MTERRYSIPIKPHDPTYGDETCPDCGSTLYYTDDDSTPRCDDCDWDYDEHVDAMEAAHDAWVDHEIKRRRGE